MDLEDALPQRIMFVGPGGAGKSTPAVRVGALLGIPVVHLDREYWLPGWTRPDAASWRGRVVELAAADRWVIDGNYGSSLGPRVERADPIVFLDLPRRVIIPAALRRTLDGRSRTRPDMAGGCRERIDLGFLRWLWRYPRQSRPIVLAAVDAVGARDRLVHLRSRRDVARWCDRDLARRRRDQVIGTWRAGRTIHTCEIDLIRVTSVLEPDHVDFAGRQPVDCG